MNDADDRAAILNPEAVGDPNQNPVVHLPDDLVAALCCHGAAPSRDGFCGGMNGFHADDCPERPAR